VVLEPVYNVTRMTAMMTALAPSEEVVEAGQFLTADLRLLTVLTNQGLAPILAPDQTAERSHVDEADCATGEGLSARRTHFCPDVSL